MSFDLLHESLRTDLAEKLGKDVKILIIDKDLIGKLSLFTDNKFLKENGVEKLYTRENIDAIPTENNVVFLCSNLKSLRSIANLINNDKVKREYRILYVSDSAFLTDPIVKSITKKIEFDVLSLDLFVLSEDLLSQEKSGTFRDLTIDGGMSIVHDAACAVAKLEVLYETIPDIIVFGPKSSNVMDQIKRMRLDNYKSSKFGKLIILDRSLDLITPLLTHHTYEGLIDDFLGIKQNVVDSFVLKPDDPVFPEIRSTNWAEATGLLSKKAKEISEKYSRLQGATIHQLKDISLSIKEHQSLEKHVNMATKISNMIDPTYTKIIHLEQAMICGDCDDKPHILINTLIAQKYNVNHVLRLVCLHSQVGCSKKTLSFYREEILQTYGFEMMITLSNLEKVGLLVIKEKYLPVSDNPYSSCYSGYTPKSISQIAGRVTKTGKTTVILFLGGCTKIGRA